MVRRPLKCFGGGSVHWVWDDSAPVGADLGESRVPGGGGGSAWDTWDRSESELVPFLLPSSVHTHAAGCWLPSRLCLPIPTHSVRLFLGLLKVMPLAWLGCYLSLPPGHHFWHLPSSPNNENNLLLTAIGKLSLLSWCRGKHLGAAPYVKPRRLGDPSHSHSACFP